MNYCEKKAKERKLEGVCGGPPPGKFDNLEVSRRILSHFN